MPPSNSESTDVLGPPILPAPDCRSSLPASWPKGDSSTTHGQVDTHLPDTGPLLDHLMVPPRKASTWHPVYQGHPLGSPVPASGPHGPGEGAPGIGPLASGCCILQVGGLCGVPGRGTQDSGDGSGAACDGESRPESSTFSGDEEEKGDGLDVKPRLLEPRKGQGQGRGQHSPRPHPDVTSHISIPSTRP